MFGHHACPKPWAAPFDYLLMGLKSASWIANCVDCGQTPQTVCPGMHGRIFRVNMVNMKTCFGVSELQIREVSGKYFLFTKTRCGYSLEEPQWCSSNEYLQHKFLWYKNKKNINVFLLKKKATYGTWSYVSLDIFTEAVLMRSQDICFHGETNIYFLFTKIIFGYHQFMECGEHLFGVFFSVVSLSYVNWKFISVVLHLPCIFGQTGWANSIDPYQMPQNVSTLFATHPAVIIIDTSTASEKDFFKFKDECGNEIRCSNI